MESYPKKVLCVREAINHDPNLTKVKMLVEYTALSKKEHWLIKGKFGYRLEGMSPNGVYYTGLFIDVDPMEEELELVKESELQEA